MVIKATVFLLLYCTNNESRTRLYKFNKDYEKQIVHVFKRRLIYVFKRRFLYLFKRRFVYVFKRRCSSLKRKLTKTIRYAMPSSEKL